MSIIIDNTRISEATVKQIVRCHKEGWQPANIASICKTKTSVVKKVLEDKSLI